MPNLFCQDCGQATAYKINKPEKCGSCGKAFFEASKHKKYKKKGSMNLEQAKQIIKKAESQKKTIRRVSELKTREQIANEEFYPDSEEFYLTKIPQTFGAVQIEAERPSVTIGDLAGTSKESSSPRFQNVSVDKEKVLAKLQKEGSAIGASEETPEI